ncbi:MAG: deoxyribodipyrimidine photo-lyase [Hoeflea sp.]|nr:deoxyribodipyrimidine photo-lyase [Hoeflea sp.]
MERTTTFDGDTAIVWFRNDLRVSDNAALMAASRHGAVLPVFIRETNSPARPLGAARTWWLHHSLERLAEKLESLGAPLLLLSGDPARIIPDLVQATGAAAVYWNRRYDPRHQAADTALKAQLQADGLSAESFAGQLLHEPMRLKTGGGTYYKVYSPFWRAMEPDIEKRPPLPAPDALPPLPAKLYIASEALAGWGLLPVAPNWSGGMNEAWTPGEDGARARLVDFLENRMQGYAERRDIPGVDATSGLSPHLASGEITPAQIIEAMSMADTDASSSDLSKFRKEVGWREFSWHLLANDPGLPDRNHNSRFDAFPWIRNENALQAWQKGLTGYPIVDAGMRELWRTGWMHNRVRMVVASFLTKHLMIDWREGEAWFWDTLVDADPASNAASWQWVAGSGADAAPYFRIFNPVLQGEKFDPDGAYVRENLPELAEMPSKYIHRPWEAPDSVLLAAGVRLGKNYPEPIIDHQAARQRALAAYQQIKDAA